MNPPPNQQEPHWLVRARRTGVLQLSPRDLTGNETVASIVQRLRNDEKDSSVKVHTVQLYKVDLLDAPLCDYLTQSCPTTIRHVRFFNTRGIAATQQVLQGLRRCSHTKLASLELLWNNGDNEAGIIEMIQQDSLPTLRKLNLTGSLTTTTCVRRVAQALRRNTSLHELIVDDCRLDDASFAFLLDSVSHSRIKKLSANGNHRLTVTSLQRALDSTTHHHLSDNNRLQSLSFQRTTLLHHGWERVAKFCRDQQRASTSLRSVFLGDCHDQGLVALFQSLEDNDFVESLGMPCTTTAALQQLFHSLPRVKGLHRISLETLTMSATNDMETLMMNAFRDNTSLGFFDTSYRFTSTLHRSTRTYVEFYTKRNRIRAMQTSTPLLGLWPHLLYKVGQSPAYYSLRNFVYHELPPRYSHKRCQATQVMVGEVKRQKTEIQLTK